MHITIYRDRDGMPAWATITDANEDDLRGAAKRVAAFLADADRNALAVDSRRHTVEVV